MVDEVMHKSAMIQQSILLHGEATLFEHDRDPYMLEVTCGHCQPVASVWPALSR